MDRGDLFDRLEPETMSSPASDSMKSTHTPGYGPRSSRAQRDIEAALNEAEELARLSSVARTRRAFSQDNVSPHMNTILDTSEQLRQQIRELRQENHESKVEVVSLRAQLSQRESTLERVQQDAEVQFAERDRTLAELTRAHTSCQQQLAALSIQLAAKDLTPEAAARLRAEHAGAMAEAARASQLASDLERRLEIQAARSADAMRCWTGVRDGLQHEASRLAAALERKAAEAQDLRQEREILRAKLSLLAPEQRGVEPRADQPSSAAVDGAALEAEVKKLREALQEREDMCHKYKVAVRTLKKRVKDTGEEQARTASAASAREQELQELLNRLSTELDETRCELSKVRATNEDLLKSSATKVDNTKASHHQAVTIAPDPASPLPTTNPQLEEAASRVAHLESLVAQAERRSCQWQSRALEAEQRAEQAGSSAEAAASAAIRLAQRQATAAEARANAAMSQVQSLRQALVTTEKASAVMAKTLLDRQESATQKGVHEPVAAIHNPTSTSPARSVKATGIKQIVPAHNLSEHDTESEGGTPKTVPETYLAEEWAQELSKHERAIQELEEKLAMQSSAAGGMSGNKGGVALTSSKHNHKKSAPNATDFHCGEPAPEAVPAMAAEARLKNLHTMLDKLSLKGTAALRDDDEEQLISSVSH